MARKDSVFKPCGAPNYETSGAPILGYSHPGKPFRPELNPCLLTGTYADSYGRPVAACCNGPFSTISYTRYRSQTLPPSFTSALSSKADGAVGGQPLLCGKEGGRLSRTVRTGGDDHADLVAHPGLNE